jgi:acyl-CoA thioester hydrolase
MSQPAPIDRLRPDARADYRRFIPVTTRWLDNDAYGHLNNAVYHLIFDSAVNTLLVEAGALDPQRGETVGFVVENGCSYFTPLAFPQALEAGVRVAATGTSSVRYEIGIFAAGAAEPSARGHFVHVSVDRATSRPVPLPAAVRRLAESLRLPTPTAP